MKRTGLGRHFPTPAARCGLIALLVYLPGFWWGAPRALDDQSIRSWGVDDEAPIGPLAQIHNIIEPKEIQNLGYPLMQSFMTAAVYAPYLGLVWLQGDFSRPSGEYPYGLSDPVRTLRVLTWLSHLLSVVLGAGIVVAGYKVAESLWGPGEAMWAGAFTLLSYPMFYYSRTGNPDVPVLFFIAAALAAFASILRSGITGRRAVWLGLWVGLAVATKEQSAASFVGIPVVLAWLAWRDRPDERPGGLSFGFVSRHGWALGVGLASCVLAFGLGSGLFVDPGRFFAHLEFTSGRIEMLRRGEIAFMTVYPRDVGGNLALVRLLAGYVADAITIPGIALAALGIGTALKRRTAAAWMVVPLATYLAVLFWATRNGQLRYLMPAAFVLSLFAARGVVLALGSRTVLRTTASAAAAWVVLAGALRGIDLTYQMIRDSRYEATAWLESRLEPGDQLDFFGPDAKLPWMPAGVRFERANEYLGAVYPPDRSPRAAERIRQRWADLAPEVILLMPDVSSREGEPHNFTLPPAVLGDLDSGALGYDLAERFHTESLFPWLSTPELDYPSANPPIRVYVPSDGGETPGRGPGSAETAPAAPATEPDA